MKWGVTCCSKKDRLFVPIFCEYNQKRPRRQLRQSIGDHGSDDYLYICTHFGVFFLQLWKPTQSLFWNSGMLPRTFVPDFRFVNSDFRFFFFCLAGVIWKSETKISCLTSLYRSTSTRYTAYRKTHLITFKTRNASVRRKNSSKRKTFTQWHVLIAKMTLLSIKIIPSTKMKPSRQSALIHVGTSFKAILTATIIFHAPVSFCHHQYQFFEDSVFEKTSSQKIKRRTALPFYDAYFFCNQVKNIVTPKWKPTFTKFVLK